MWPGGLKFSTPPSGEGLARCEVVPKFGQLAKCIPHREGGIRDDDTTAIHGGVQGEGSAGSAASGQGAEIRDLHAKIGEWTVERDFLGQRAQVVSRDKCRAMIRRDQSRAELKPSMPLAFHRPIFSVLRPRARVRRTLGLCDGAMSCLKYPFYGSR